VTGSDQGIWQDVYLARSSSELSWHQDRPISSLDLFHRLGITPDRGVVDIGGGDSALVDSLVQRGFRDVTVLDLSERALFRARRRLGEGAESVNWLVEDVRSWRPKRAYQVWHDRAVFHFMTDEKDQAAYISVLRASLDEGASVVIGTFALSLGSASSIGPCA